MNKKFFIFIVMVVPYCGLAMEKGNRKGGYSSEESSSYRSGSFRSGSFKKRRDTQSMLDDPDIENSQIFKVDGASLSHLYYGPTHACNESFLSMLDNNLESLKTESPDQYEVIAKILGKYRKEKEKNKFYSKFFSEDGEDKKNIAALINQTWATLEKSSKERIRNSYKQRNFACGMNGIICLLSGALFVSTLLPIVILCNS